MEIGGLEVRGEGGRDKKERTKVRAREKEKRKGMCKTNRGDNKERRRKRSVGN